MQKLYEQYRLFFPGKKTQNTQGCNGILNVRYRTTLYFVSITSLKTVRCCDLVITDLVMPGGVLCDQESQARLGCGA